MKIEGWDFYDTLKYLAAITGVTLKSQPQDQKSKLKEELYKINKLAAIFYHHLLIKHDLGQPGRDYLEKRKINTAITNRFFLGYAPTGWNSLTNFLKTKHIKLETAVEAGVVVNNRGRYYDRFRQRLIFPLFNILGEVVGFGGRRLNDKDEKTPKYINSPETLIYHKSKHLFGLYQAKNFIKRSNFAIITEGEFDVLSSYQAGVKNIVAVKGSNLTINHLKAISRYSKKVKLCFDADTAGTKAIEKSLVLADNANLYTQIIELPQGKDIDELIKINPDQWRRISQTAKTGFNFLLVRLADKVNFKDPYQKKEYLKRIFNFINQINDVLLKDEYLTATAEFTGLSEALIKQSFNQIQNPAYNKASTADNESQTKTKQVSTEVYILSLLIISQNLKLLDMIDDISLFHPGQQKLIKLMKQYQLDKSVIETNLPPELIDLYNEIFIIPEASQINQLSPDKLVKEFKASWQHLQKQHLLDQINGLKNIIKEKEESGQDINPELTKLNSYLKKLKRLSS